jgi:hypothetical protein
MNQEIVIQEQLSLSNDCYHCMQLNELCQDCLDSKEARDADIAWEIVDEGNESYVKIPSKKVIEPSAHEWISNEIITRINPKTGEKTFRTELFEASAMLIDRIYDLDESLTVSKYETVCDSCHYIFNKHAVCPNCN